MRNCHSVLSLSRETYRWARCDQGTSIKSERSERESSISPTSEPARYSLTDNRFEQRRRRKFDLFRFSAPPFSLSLPVFVLEAPFVGAWTTPAARASASDFRSRVKFGTFASRDTNSLIDVSERDPIESREREPRRLAVDSTPSSSPSPSAQLSNCAGEGGCGEVNQPPLNSLPRMIKRNGFHACHVTAAQDTLAVAFGPPRGSSILLPPA